ncbi:MAG: alcohol dehydrogenase catalytic domain-containing protein, partial [Paracoccaceae bacterium]|nr:alcohol dehydrogenase catalytic domain-containing protein [Paracoccaceae bacterium]
MTLPSTMRAMVTMGHGDLDQMVWREDWPRPDPASGEVLIRVGACGLNNTDVNTRTGWYSKVVSEGTTGEALEVEGQNDPSWGGKPITFPRIQGADVCGEIVGVGAGVSEDRIGQRVITDNWLRDPASPLNMSKVGYFGSERNGGFAEYTTIPAANALAVRSDLT